MPPPGHRVALTFELRTRDGKEPSLLGFGSVRVLQKIGVRFGSSSLQAQKQWVRFCSLLYVFGKRLTVSSQLITQLENCNL